MPLTIAEQHAFLDDAKNFAFATCREKIEKNVEYVNCQPSGRWTCLHQACYMGDASMVEFLLARAADITVVNRDGETPKQVAAGRGHPDCVKLIDDSTITKGKNKGKNKSSDSPGGQPAPKSQKVTMKNGAAQVKFDSSKAASSGTMVVKGQAAVDASCPIGVDTHVYEADDDDVYDCLLNQVDIASNANKYYILQLLETDASPAQYYAWTRWGRVGEELNKQNALLGPIALDEALKEFNKKFKEKTKNNWADRANFVKHDKKYQLVLRDYGASSD